MPDRGVPVAILPLGSANNIARSFGVAGAPYELAEILHPLYWQRYSMGVVRGPWGRRRFVEAVGLGSACAHDAEAVARRSVGCRQSARRPRRAAQDSEEGQGRSISTCCIDGKPLPGDILAIEIMNIVYTGPGLPLAPSADPGDRMLEVICARPADRRAMMDWIRKPQHRNPPGSARRGRIVQIVWRGDPMRIDDDVIDAPKLETVVTVALERAAAKILVPPPRGIRRLWSDWR